MNFQSVEHNATEDNCAHKTVKNKKHTKRVDSSSFNCFCTSELSTDLTINSIKLGSNNPSKWRLSDIKSNINRRD